MLRVLAPGLLLAAIGCVAPLDLGAPCDPNDDECAADLVCTPLEDRAICAPNLGDEPPPPSPCVARTANLLNIDGRITTSAAAVDAGRSRFGIFWSSNANTFDEGEARFTLVESRSDAPPTTVTVAGSGFQRVFARALAYSEVSDRYAAVWSQDDELIVRVLDAEGTPLGPARPTGFRPELLDNLDLVVVDGAFELFVSVREQDGGAGGFAAAGLHQISLDEDGVATERELLDGAVFDGRTMVDADGVTWFTFSEGSVVENHVSVGRITADGTVELRFAELPTNAGVIGSQVLPFASGVRVMWRDQGAGLDQLCLVDSCDTTKVDAPFEPAFYSDNYLDVVVDGDIALFGFLDRGSNEQTLLRYDAAEERAFGFTAINPGEDFPGVTVAVDRDATLAVYPSQVRAGSNAEHLDLQVLCAEDP